MNKLTVGDGGFLESPGSPLAAFDAAKKRKLLEFARDYVESHQKAPSMATLADAVGIAAITLERHLAKDEAFKAHFREILWKADAILDDAMFARAKEPGGFMDRMAWKRRHFPELWVPERQNMPDGPQVVINISPEVLEKARLHSRAIDAQVAREIEEGGDSRSPGHPDE